MMTESDSSPPSAPWVRKLLIPAGIGAIFGFAATYGMLQYLDSDAVGGLGKSATIAALVGTLYCLIAFGMLFGVASPNIGAKFLNVQDADELREQQRVLTLSSIAMGLWGAALLALALAAPDGPVPQSIALLVGVGGLLIGTALSVVCYRASDELMLAINLEAGAISYGLTFAVIGLWSVLAHLGYVTGPQPLDLLTLFYGLVLVASFIAIGRRGMLSVK